MSSRVKNMFSGQVAGAAQALDNTGPQVLRTLQVLNTTVAVAYLQIFNIAAASVVLGTTAPTLSIGIPLSGMLVYPFPENGQHMKGNALSCAGTTTRTGAVAAALDINIGWGE